MLLLSKGVSVPSLLNMPALEKQYLLVPWLKIIHQNLELCLKLCHKPEIKTVATAYVNLLIVRVCKESVNQFFLCISLIHTETSQKQIIFMGRAYKN